MGIREDNERMAEEAGQMAMRMVLAFLQGKASIAVTPNFQAGAGQHGLAAGFTIRIIGDQQ